MIDNHHWPNEMTMDWLWSRGGYSQNACAQWGEGGEGKPQKQEVNYSHTNWIKISVTSMNAECGCHTHVHAFLNAFWRDLFCHFHYLSLKLISVSVYCLPQFQVKLHTIMYCNVTKYIVIAIKLHGNRPTAGQREFPGRAREQPGGGKRINVKAGN